MKTRWQVPLLLSVFLASSATAQTPSPLAEAEALVDQGNYGEGLDRLLKLGAEQSNLRTGTLMARCACEIPAKKDAGLRLFTWLIEQSPYKTDRAERARLIEQAKRCGYAPPWVRVSLELPARGQAGMTGASKLFHVLAARTSGEGNGKDKEMGVTTEPLRFKNHGSEADPKLAKEFRGRVFGLDQEEEARKKIRAVAGPTFKVVATQSFLVAGSGTHSEAKLRQIGEDLEGFRSFLETTYSLVPFDHFVTLYLVPSKEDLRSFAGKVHSLSTSKTCIGYSFPADASIVAVIPGERIGTLRHELVHTLVTSRFPDFPPWLDEGLASLYEESRREGDRVLGVSGWRQELLREMWFLRPRVPELLAMRRDAFNAVGGDVERQAVNHATARTLMLFVQEKQRLPEVFTNFRPPNPLEVAAAGGPKPLDRLAQALQMDGTRIDDEFARWFGKPPH